MSGKVITTFVANRVLNYKNKKTKENFPDNQEEFSNKSS